MILTSNILGELGSSVKRAITGPHETSITVPPVVQPTILLRNALRLPNQSSPTLNTTGLLQATVTQTNGAFLTNNLGTLNEGLWELLIMFHYSANYSSVVAQGGQLSILKDNITMVLFQANTIPTLGGSVTFTESVLLTLDTPAFFSILVSTNGVGQTHSVASSILASKLF
jgi:hypothetical protein